MKKYTEMTPQERQAEYAAVKAKFEQQEQDRKQIRRTEQHRLQL